MRNTTIALAWLLAGLCACAAPSPRHWSKPGATAVLENVFLSCMDSRGYKLDPKGNLVVPTAKP